MNYHQHYQRGALLVYVLVFSSILLVLLSAVMTFILSQYTSQERRVAEERALAIAEAGLNKYKWFLAHNIDNTTYGTGLPGPYEIPITDPEVGFIGTSSLQIASSSYCGEVMDISITSTGRTAEHPDIQRTVYGKYARPTVTEFSFITNANVWFGGGGDPTIGPIHANGGIRMDGRHNSTVTSGQTSWTCDGSFGCSPTQTVDGIFGSGPDSALWDFPSPPVDFAGITLDLSVMRNRAMSGGGIHYPRSSGYGYHVLLQPDSTVDIYEVTDVTTYWARNSSVGWFVDNDIIQNETLIASDQPIDPNCPVLFFEDDVWLEGEFSGNVSLAAASTTAPSGSNHSIIIEGDVANASSSGGLLAVAMQDVELGIDIPETTDLEGIFIAQEGSFMRNYVTWGNLPWGYKSKYIIDEVDFLGTIVSKTRAGTSWVNSSGVVVSGVDDFKSSYDRDLVDSPPAFTPKTSDNYRFLEWREERP